LKITIIYNHYFAKMPRDTYEQMRLIAPKATFFEAHYDTVTARDLIDSEVIFGPPPRHMLKELENLKWLHLTSAGADSMTDCTLYANPNIILTKSSGSFGVPIAEHVVGMMLSLGQGFGHYFEKQREAKWAQTWQGESVDIYNSTVFVLGLGDIGTEVCRRLSCFGANLVGFRYDISKPHEIVSDVRPMSELSRSLPEADYIVICLPGTADTKGLLGRDEFALMKKRMIIVNIGRGSIIDTDALVDALNLGQILGAGLDVTDPEPLPDGHPLFTAKNVLITPHVSAASPSTNDRRIAVFMDLLKHYADDKPLPNQVSFDKGY